VFNDDDEITPLETFFTASDTFCHLCHNIPRGLQDGTLYKKKKGKKFRESRVEKIGD